jgi:hypothetical protein
MILPFVGTAGPSSPSTFLPVLRLTLSNLYFLKANEAIWQSRRFVAVAASVGDADHGVTRTRSRDDCGGA